MASLTPRQQIWIADPHTHYGYIESRGYDARLRVVDGLDRNQWQLENLLGISELGVVMLKPVYRPEHNGTADWSFTGTNDAGTLTLDVCQHIEAGAATCAYQGTGGSSVQWWATTASTTLDYGWYLDLWLGYPSITREVGGWPVAMDGAASVEFIDPNCSQAYGIAFEHGERPRLEYSTSSGTTWKTVDSVKEGNPVGFGAWSRIMLMRAAGRTIASIDGGQGVAWLEHSNPGHEDVWDSGAIHVRGTGLAAAFHWQKLYHKGDGTVTIPQVKRGFGVSVEATAWVYGTTPTDCTMSATAAALDADSYYCAAHLSAATVAGTGLATMTPLLESIGVRYPEQQIAPAAHQKTLMSGVSGITENLAFDPNTLNIYNHTVIEFVNEDQAYTWASGVRSCELFLGYDEVGVHRRMTGLCGYVMEWGSADGDRSYRLHAYDRSMQLKSPAGVMVANLPYMDGWCIYKAMRFLANYAGVTDAALAFPICDCDSDSDPPCGHYLLPKGDEFHPLVKFPAGMYAWECMQRLQKYVGYVMYFDGSGYLQFYQWIPSAPGPYKKIFNETGTFDRTRPRLDELRTVGRTRDMRGVRNDVLIIGIDPETWDPIVAHNQDLDSVHNINAPNYMGYRSSMVWADDMFATAAYASQALDSLWNYLRTPHDVIGLEGWMQPDLYPLDVIGLTEKYAAPELRPYYITNLTNTYRLVGGGGGMLKDPSCHIQAQHLTPWG